MYVIWLSQVEHFKFINLSMLLFDYKVNKLTHTIVNKSFELKYSVFNVNNKFPSGK